jgi:N6-adenosine-specific RNA methylase IME4
MIDKAQKYSCILADPPWPMRMASQRKRSKEGKKPDSLPYPTMSLEDICKLGVGSLAEPGCHLWLWTTNSHLKEGFQVMESWGFKYLVPIHWVKPSGMGNWFIHRTQTLLFGYKEKCVFPLERYKPNVLFTTDPVKHSQKPDESYRLIESISPGPRLELFARRKIDGWDSWGNEVECDTVIAV